MCMHTKVHTQHSPLTSLSLIFITRVAPHSLSSLSLSLPPTLFSVLFSVLASRSLDVLLPYGGPPASSIVSLTGMLTTAESTGSTLFVLHTKMRIASAPPVSSMHSSSASRR